MEPTTATYIVGVVVVAALGFIGVYANNRINTRERLVTDLKDDTRNLKTKIGYLENQVEEIKSDAINSEDVRRIVKEENEPLHADMRDIKNSQTELKQLFQNTMIQLAETRGYNKARQEDN